MEQTGQEASSYETYALEKIRLPGDYGDTIQILLLGFFGVGLVEFWLFWGVFWYKLSSDLSL